MSKRDKIVKQDHQEWFTPEEAADYLRVSRQTIYNYINEGRLKFYELKGGRGKRFRRADLDSLLEEPSPEEQTEPSG